MDGKFRNRATMTVIAASLISVSAYFAFKHGLFGGGELDQTAVEAPDAASEIARRTKDVVAEVTGGTVTELKDETRLADDLGADSVQQMEIVQGLKDDFQLTIGDEDTAKLCGGTVGGLIRYVQERQAGSPERAGEPK